MNYRSYTNKDKQVNMANVQNCLSKLCYCIYTFLKQEKKIQYKNILLPLLLGPDAAVKHNFVIGR